jgi:short-subunit dehydrogenase
MKVARMSRFNNRTVLITGASSGIGAELARQFAAEGANLLLAARRLDKLDEVVRSLPQPRGSVRVFECDVTRDEPVKALVDDVHGQGGVIDLVVANAGFGIVGPVQKLSLADYERQFETNVWGVLRTLYATLPDLKQTRGQFVIMGSVAGYVPQPGVSPYGMSKFAIRVLAECIRADLAAEGVSVTLLSPGFIDSDIRRTDNRGHVHAHVRDPVPDFIRVPTAKAVRHMLSAIYKRKRESIVTGHGKLIVWTYRLFPGLVRLVYRAGLKSRREPA